MTKLLFFAVLITSFQIHASIEMAITVDDLPRHGPISSGVTRMQITQDMLKTFKKHNVTEVYGFVNFKKVEEQPELLNTLVTWREAGYPLANHTYSHLYLPDNSLERYLEEIKLNEPNLNRLNRENDWHWFRYPFLVEGETQERRDSIRKFLKEQNYKVAQVTIDFGDWAFNEPYVRCKNKNDQANIQWLKKTYLRVAAKQIHVMQELGFKIFKRKDIKHILLLHIGEFGALMLDDLLKVFEKESVKFISLAEASRDPIYLTNPNRLGRDGTSFLRQWAEVLKIPSPSYKKHPKRKTVDDLCK